MPKNETSMTMEEECIEPKVYTENVESKRRILDLNIKLFYWQGLLYEDPNATIDFHLENSAAFLRPLILNHRHLYSTLRSVARIYPKIILAMIVWNCLVTHPMGVYTYWDDKKVVIDNIYPTGISFLISVCIGSALFYQKKILGFVIILQELAGEANMDNDEQSDLIKQTDWYSHNLTKYMHLSVDTFVAVFMTVTALKDCLPHRVQQVRGWYPFDETASPAYEITLTLYTLQIILGFILSNACITSVVSSVVYLGVLLKIATNKFKNIRQIAITLLTDRKRAEIDRLSRARKEFVLLVQETLVPEGGILRTSGSVIENVEDLPLMQPTSNINVAVFLTKTRVRMLEARSKGRNREENAWKNRQEGLGYELRREKYMEGKIRNRKVRRSKQKHKEHINVTDPTSQLFTSEELDEEMHLLLKRYIQYHRKILKTIEVFNDIMEIYFITSFLINIFIYGATFLLITTGEVLGIKEMIILLVTFEVVVLFLVMNFLADFISEQASAVGDAVFACDWLGASLSFKRSMLIVMSRTNRPLYLKPKGLQPLSLKMFTEVCKAAYKMTTTLKSLLK